MVGINHVLVEPDSDHTHMMGYLVPDDEDHHHLNITGTVLEVGKSRFIDFNKHLVLKSELSLFSREVKMCSPLKHGDRIIFSHTVKLTGIQFEGKLIVPMDMIYAKFPLEAVNGWVLVKMMEEDKVDGGYFLPTNDRNKYGWGKIVSYSPALSYRDYDSFDVEAKEGDLICFAPKSAARLELDVHNQFEGQSSLFKLRPKDILWVL